MYFVELVESGLQTRFFFTDGINQDFSFGVLRFLINFALKEAICSPIWGIF